MGKPKIVIQKINGEYYFHIEQDGQVTRFILDQLAFNLLLLAEERAYRYSEGPHEAIPLRAIH